VTLEENVKDFGITYFGLSDKRQGIVHVIGPEQGFTLPGTTVVCGDSHTSTHGAFGALAFGIGTVCPSFSLFGGTSRRWRLRRRNSVLLTGLAFAVRSRTRFGDSMFDHQAQQKHEDTGRGRFSPRCQLQRCHPPHHWQDRDGRRHPGGPGIYW